MPPESSEAFAGHDPETGILSRLRDWTDVAPPLMLGRTLRMAGSPLMMPIVWAACVFTADGFPRDSSVTVAPWSAAGKFLGFMILWLPLLMIGYRQGALLTAGREMETPAKVLGRIFRRSPWVLATLVIAPLAVAALALPGWVATWFLSWGSGVPVVSTLVAVVGGLAMLPAAVLAAGAVIAVPMALSALVNESDPDPLDALSRGYEYALRGWLRGIGYWVTAAVFSLAIYPAAWAVSFAIQMIVQTITPEPIAGDIVAAAFVLPIAAVAWVAIGCTGGVYLLLRRATGGQEIEDIWTDDRPETVPLPELKIDRE